MKMNILNSNMILNRVGTDLFKFLSKIFVKQLMYESKQFTTASLLKVQKSDSSPKREESMRMRQFHEKLKLQPIPRVPPRERFVDLVLVETDRKNGELIANSEKDPTKWGDWQNGGRVTDF